MKISEQQILVFIVNSKCNGKQKQNHLKYQDICMCDSDDQNVKGLVMEMRPPSIVETQKL